MKSRPVVPLHRIRHYFVLGMLVAGLGTLVVRAAQVQLLESQFLQSKGDVNYLTVQVSHANRGMILDRHGEPLAVSSPVDSVVADPKSIFREHSFDDHQRWDALAKLLKEPLSSIKGRISKNPESEFAYLKRQLDPELARKVKALAVPGISLLREYKRYYPGGPVFGQIVGYTDTDQNGLTGIEKTFNDSLSGTAGRTRVLRDGQGRVIEYVEQLSPTVDGRDLRLSIDARVQYLAYRYLKAAVKKHHADSASTVVLDARTGEILAMVSEPSVNPNTRDRAELTSSRARDRAVQSVFEPGSSIKPFTIAAALTSGRFLPDTRIDTNPGVFNVGGYPIRDVHNYGLLTVSRVLIKSSNVGAAKVALQLDPKKFPAQFHKLGFGTPTGIPLPGEEAGHAPPAGPLTPREQASLAYGYGISANVLQLARAYTVLAGDGRLLDVRLTPGPAHYSRRVYSPEVVHQVQRMLEKATAEGGTGTQAQVPDYAVAGKTGTVVKWLESKGRYADDQYLSVFAGYAPARDPRLIMVVVVNNPKGEQYYGGLVSAPVFSNVMNGALHLLNVPSHPDKPALRQAMFEGGSDT
jgi:cell division protein FtsI (penicillin-binding protein 3)